MRIPRQPTSRRRSRTRASSAARNTTLLDLDHGTYPFVTSSSPTAGGACVGAGVGSGPFPTELDDEDGRTFIEVGHEFGTTTGRERRAGWYDAVIVRYAVEVNGLTDLIITKLDVLSAFDTIKVCVAYEYEGRQYKTVPGHQTVFHHAKPVYEELPGWKTDITGCRTFEELPKEARDYITFIEDLADVPVAMIAVGPSREQTIMRRWESRP